MFKKNYKKIVFILFLLLPSKFVSAGSLFGGVTCMQSGDCNLNDMLRVVVNATNVLLGLSGSVALLYFVYGGITFLISGGSAEKVSSGKQIITNAVIGLIIIFTSFVVIKFTMEALGFTQSGVFGPWNQSLE